MAKINQKKRTGTKTSREERRLNTQRILFTILAIIMIAAMIIPLIINQ